MTEAKFPLNTDRRYTACVNFRKGYRTNVREWVCRINCDCAAGSLSTCWRADRSFRFHYTFLSNLCGGMIACCFIIL